MRYVRRRAGRRKGRMPGSHQCRQRQTLFRRGVKSGLQRQSRSKIDRFTASARSARLSFNPRERPRRQRADDECIPADSQTVAACSFMRLMICACVTRSCKTRATRLAVLNRKGRLPRSSPMRIFSSRCPQQQGISMQQFASGDTQSSSDCSQRMSSSLSALFLLAASSLLGKKGVRLTGSLSHQAARRRLTVLCNHS